MSKNCEICYEPKPLDHFETLSCSHSFCRSCLKLYIKSILSSKDYSSLKCPSKLCENKNLFQTAKSILAFSEYEKLKQDHLYFSLSKSPNFHPCPQPDCRGFALNTKPSRSSLHCNTCHFEFCLNCNKNHSKTSHCSNELSHYMRETGAKSCPGCKNLVIKATGCMNMTCRCGTRFCMFCGSTLTSKHDWFSCLIGYPSPSLFTIFFLSLSLVTFPFQIAFYAIRTNISEKNESLTQRLSTLLFHLLIIILSPIGTLWIIISLPVYYLFHPDKKNVFSYLPKKKWVLFLKPFVFAVSYLLFIALSLIFYIIINVYLTFCGLVFLLRKVTN